RATGTDSASALAPVLAPTPDDRGKSESSTVTPGISGPIQGSIPDRNVTILAVSGNSTVSAAVNASQRDAEEWAMQDSNNSRIFLGIVGFLKQAVQNPVQLVH